MPMFLQSLSKLGWSAILFSKKRNYPKKDQMKERSRRYKTDPDDDDVQRWRSWLWRKRGTGTLLSPLQRLPWEDLRGLDRVFTDAVISEKQKEHLRLKKYSWSIFIWKYPILKSFSTSLFSYSKTQNRFTGSTFYCFSALSSPEQETKG